MTRDITLLPIGGLARLERMPEKPIQELWVALAGPVVNIVIAVLLFIGLFVTGKIRSLSSLFSLSWSSGGFIERLMVVNVTLMLFNLLPAFPMDGGRVVRALLALRLEYNRATRIAATIGQGMALLFGIYGLFTNPMLVLIAVFVWFGASQEASMVQVKSVLSNIPVSRAMQTDFKTLTPTDPLSRATQLILSGSQQDFPVVVEGKVVGLLTREVLVRALSEHQENMFVSHVMQKDFQVIDFAQTLETISPHIQAERHGVFPVTQNGTLVGLLTIENVSEFLMIQRAINSRVRAQAVNSG